MPELPEVETIRAQLDHILPGHVIKDIQIRKTKSFIGDPKRLSDTRIQKVRRYGKIILIDTSGGLSIAVHLKMTGQLLYLTQDMSHNMRGVGPLLLSLPDTYTRVILTFENTAQLFFRDMRIFGWMKIVSKQESEKIRSDLGPDPLSEITPITLYEILRGSKRPVKLVLMDQEKIAGIGNIYANDALFLSHIHPKTPAGTLSKEQAGKLYQSIFHVLTAGIRYKGASRTNFMDVFGKKGSVQEHFHVYDREGKPCPNHCGEKIKRIKLGGRGTFFCPACQRV